MEKMLINCIIFTKQKKVIKIKYKKKWKKIVLNLNIKLMIYFFLFFSNILGLDGLGDYSKGTLIWLKEFLFISKFLGKKS
jgi:hypothetical protein